jgi:hypothetical protein
MEEREQDGHAYHHAYGANESYENRHQYEHGTTFFMKFGDVLVQRHALYGAR